MALPEVPKLENEKLMYFLKQLSSEVVSLRKSLGSFLDGSDGSDGAAGGEFLPVYETSGTSLADQGTGAEDAWTTIASGAEAGARFAMIQFEINSDDYTDDVKMYFRRASGDQEVKVLDITPGGDVEMDHRDPMVWYFVPLTTGGDFDYKVDTTSTPNWSITRLGYVL
jgi:hypothetical protein